MPDGGSGIKEERVKRLTKGSALVRPMPLTDSKHAARGVLGRKVKNARRKRRVSGTHERATRVTSICATYNF